MIPAIHNLQKPARACQGLDLVMGAPREATIGRALVHAAGLGAQTAFLALEFDS